MISWYAKHRPMFYFNSNNSFSFKILPIFLTDGMISVSLRSPVKTSLPEENMRNDDEKGSRTRKISPGKTSGSYIDWVKSSDARSRLIFLPVSIETTKFTISYFGISVISISNAFSFSMSFSSTWGAWWGFFSPVITNFPFENNKMAHLGNRRRIHKPGNLLGLYSISRYTWLNFSRGIGWFREDDMTTFSILYLAENFFSPRFAVSAASLLFRVINY